MGSVTIASMYGNAGSTIAREVAEELGLPLIDRAIPVEVAERIAHPLDQALADDEREPRHLVTRLLDGAISTSGLFVGVPIGHSHLGDDEHVHATEEALRKTADTGGAVILGRAGVFVLAERTDTLRVRLIGSPEMRVRAAMRHLKVDEETSRRQLEEVDRARAAYLDHFYPRQDWRDPEHYHLLLDSTVLSEALCTRLIVAAARDLFSRA
jgi:cytidylate kinase